MNKNYLLILCTILLIPQYLFSQNFWSRIESPTNAFLRTLHFADSSRGWVAGDSGLIYYTSDGGINWTQQPTGSINKVIDLFFLDDNRAWGLAWADNSLDNNFIGTYILKTTDGGQNWSSEQYREENVFMRAIYFLDTLNGFLGGEPGEFLSTIDGGLNWRDVTIDTVPLSHFPVKNIDFYNDLYGFASGGRIDIAGVVWKTTDGGNFWTVIDTAYTPPDEIWDIHFFDSLNIIACGGDPELFGVGFLISSDGGESWEFREIGIFGQARAISFRTENEGWCPVPLSESLIATYDYGKNWTEYIAPDTSEIYDLEFTDSLTGYAVGQEGVILKYKYDKPDYVADDDISSLSGFSISQNYPNPFNPTTRIDYELPVEGIVTIKIYDVLGREVKSLINSERKSAGEYTIEFNAENLLSGIYFYNIKIDSFNRTMKMILLK